MQEAASVMQAQSLLWAIQRHSSGLLLPQVSVTGKFRSSGYDPPEAACPFPGL